MCDWISDLCGVRKPMWISDRAGKGSPMNRRTILRLLLTLSSGYLLLLSLGCRHQDSETSQQAARDLLEGQLSAYEGGLPCPSSALPVELSIAKQGAAFQISDSKWRVKLDRKYDKVWPEYLALVQRGILIEEARVSRNLEMQSGVRFVEGACRQRAKDGRLVRFLIGEHVIVENAKRTEWTDLYLKCK